MGVPRKRYMCRTGLTEGVKVGNSRGLKLSQNLKQIEIQRTTSAPSVYLMLAGILLTIGCFILFISIELGDYEGLPGIIIRWSISLAIIGIGSTLAWRSICQLRPGFIVVDSEKIQLIENKKIEKEIYWSNKVRVMPLVNHALGYNSLYGFRVRQNKVLISASPDEGWPRSELQQIIIPLANYAKEKDARLSSDFNFVDGIEIEGLVPNDNSFMNTIAVLIFSWWLLTFIIFIFSFTFKWLWFILGIECSVIFIIVGIIIGKNQDYYIQEGLDPMKASTMYILAVISIILCFLIGILWLYL